MLSLGWSLLGFALVAGFVVLAHEVGHFWVGRWLGIPAERFSIGFGRSVLRWRWGSTVYQVGWLPLGGYVRFDEAAFRGAPVERRALVMAAGAAGNWLSALALLVLVVGAGVGVPASVAGRVDVVQEGSSADAAGLRAGDLIVAVDGVPVGDGRGVVERLRRGGPLALEVERAGAGRLVLELAAPAPGVPYGVAAPLSMALPATGWARAPAEGLRQALLWTQRTVGTVVGLVGGDSGASSVSGPGGIALLAGRVMEENPWSLLLVIAVLSVNLAVLNLLPVPLLDGGQLVLCAVEALRRRPLGRAAEAVWQGVGVAALVLLLGLALWSDALTFARAAG